MPKQSKSQLSIGDQIDRDSYKPAYIQLADILRTKIGNGQFRPGEQLPSEAELRTQYQVSQMTVRKGVGLLQKQGLVDTAQGKGSFVRPLKLEMFSFQLTELQAIFRDRERTSIKLLEVKLEYPDDKTAEKLSVPKDERVVYIRRLILRDQKPVLLHSEKLIYDPTRPLVESEMEVTSLDGLISGNGQTEFKKGELTISADVANADDARLLEVPYPSALFHLEHVFFDFNDRVVSWGQFLYRSDLYNFSTRVGLW
jgi:GntR family transcriptional regulator